MFDLWPFVADDGCIIRGIWCATDHEGLLVFDLKHHAMRQFMNNKLDESSINDNTLRTIYLDKDGLIWIGSYKNGVHSLHTG